MDPEVYSELENQIRQLSDMVSLQAAAMTTMGKAIEDSYNAINSMNGSNKKYTSNQNTLNQAVSKNTDSMNAYQRAEQKANNQLQITKDALATAFEGAGTALRGLGTAMMSTQQGFQKYNSTVDTVGRTSWEVGKNFGLLGKSLGGLTLLFSKLFQYQTKQADGLLAASDSLARMGAANGMSAEQIRQMGRGAGLASTELEKMIKPMESVQGGFIALGSTQAEGVKAFGGMINVSEGVRRSFLKLGLDDQARIQMSADFVDYLNQSGQSLNSQNMTKQGLSNAMIAYTKRVYTLAGFAGMDIETAKKKIAAANANQTVLLFGIQQKDKVNRLTEKLNATSDEAERASLQREIDQTNTKDEQFQVFTRGLMAQGIEGDQLAALQAEYLTGVTTEASKGFTIAGGSIANIRKGIENGTMTESDVAGAVANTYKKFAVTYGEAMMLVPEFAQIVGVNSEILAKSMQRTEAEIAKAGKIVSNNVNGAFAGLGAAGADPAQKVRGDLVETERKLKLLFDDMAAKMNPLLGNFGALKMLIAGAIAASVALAYVASRDGLPDITDMFGGGGKGKKGRGGKPIRDPKTGRFMSRAAAKEAGLLGGGLKGMFKSGSLLKMGKGLAGGLGSLLGGFALDMGADYARQTGHAKTGGVLSTGSAALAGAGFGAMIGSAVPILGTAAGGIIGGLLGTGYGLWANRKDLFGDKKQEKEKPQPPNAIQTLKSMLDQILLLQTYDLDPSKVENNAQAVSSYAYGLTAMFDLATAADSAKKAETIAKISKAFHGSDPPIDQFKYFSSLSIDPTKADTNARAFISFANAMSQYKGGPGLSDSISSLLGKGFNVLFGQDGPVDAFRRFAQEDFGPNASTNAEAFLKYAQASAIAGGAPAGPNPAPPNGGGGFFQQVKDVGAQIVAPITNMMSPSKGEPAPPAQANNTASPAIPIPKAKNGGVFSGPSIGYLEDTNPSEMIAPLNPKSILMKLAKTEINTSNVTNTTVPEVENQSSMNMALYTMINEKIDTMNRILENSHDKHNRLLQVVKV